MSDEEFLERMRSLMQAIGRANPRAGRKKLWKLLTEAVEADPELRREFGMRAIEETLEESDDWIKIGNEWGKLDLGASAPTQPGRPQADGASE